jgi:hypothetical protein
VQNRLADSNRNLAAKVLQLLGDIARAMGPPFDRAARGVLLFPAVANLSDNKKQVGLGGLWGGSAVVVGVLVLGGVLRWQARWLGRTCGADHKFHPSTHHTQHSCRCVTRWW